MLRKTMCAVSLRLSKTDLTNQKSLREPQADTSFNLFCVTSVINKPLQTILSVLKAYQNTHKPHFQT
jgi:hypothetical protein